MTFNQEQAIKDYTELMRRIHVGAYTERSAEDYETGTYPEDGVEQSIHHLEMLAAEHGLVFHWHKDTQIYSLEPISDEEEATSPPFSPPEKESDDNRRGFYEEEMLLLVKRDGARERGTSMTKPTQIFVIGDQVQLVVTQHYVPADHSKDVVGIVGRVTGIDKHFEHDSLWLYKVTFPHYHEYQVFNHAAPAKRVEEEIELTFWYDQLELVDMEAQS